MDAAYALRPGALEQAIREDLAAGHVPLAVVATLGTTGSTAIDPLAEIAAIARRFGLWLHVDAAYAGSALLLPEFRWMIEGVEGADSFVFNPHKWLLTNFDCSAYFVKDETALVRTFEILPEYLKTSEAERVNNYRDWGIQLGQAVPCPQALVRHPELRRRGTAGNAARTPPDGAGAWRRGSAGPADSS